MTCNVRALSMDECELYVGISKSELTPEEFCQVYCLQENYYLGPGLWLLRKRADVGVRDLPPTARQGHKIVRKADGSYIEVEIAKRLWPFPTFTKGRAVVATPAAMTVVPPTTVANVAPVPSVAISVPIVETPSEMDTAEPRNSNDADYDMGVSWNGETSSEREDDEAEVSTKTVADDSSATSSELVSMQPVVSIGTRPARRLVVPNQLPIESAMTPVKASGSLRVGASAHGISPVLGESKKSQALRPGKKRRLDTAVPLRLEPSKTALPLADESLTVEVARAHIDPAIPTLVVEGDDILAKQPTAPLPVWGQLQSEMARSLWDSCCLKLAQTLPLAPPTEDDSICYDYDVSMETPSSFDISFELNSATASEPKTLEPSPKKRQRKAPVATTPRRVTRSQTKHKLAVQGITDENVIKCESNHYITRRWERWACGHLHSAGLDCSHGHHT
ncbi:hypothetical protein ACHHYP_14829 [Achlya hypogyna]|uniref:Uncharacterized protein n=1 Tax=Achlya hypogyna TaxID=1202772 RepID=A0A1V9YCC4_ACHHY|nr:hypothetical protein ACHHYP_14829 [Achlya hypogyna]